ncbi:hypothetical protein AG1IA_07022 [Rhizoctonia solani AG-1 IA]|uniref:Uncharacterized protein n=1 Tax=Thanatephorus cucumeris (strain AG1-IA) TaxID=983506 RepID=L8WLX9_THACA|nr:hypothetical protein AG1IA_07022 [Rhizoctonia solani AG-1 IA]
MALAVFAVATVPLAMSSPPKSTRGSYKASGTGSISLVKKVKGDARLRAPGRYKTQGPFALKGWNTHGISGAVSCIDTLWNTFQVLSELGLIRGPIAGMSSTGGNWLLPSVSPPCEYSRGRLGKAQVQVRL